MKKSAGDKMLSQRVKYAMAHLSRKEHTTLLARPPWRRLHRIDMNMQADPFKVRRAALRSRTSKRIRVMAQPRYVTKKYDPAALLYPYPRIHPKTLSATATKRIDELALPKRRFLLATMKLVPTKSMKTTVNDLLVKVRKSRYQRYRVYCNARQEREAKKKKKLMAKLRRNLAKPEDWQRHMRVLERLTAPRVIWRPKKKPSKRRKYRPVDVKRLDTLAQPTARETPLPKDLFMVSERALTYRVTKRIEQLALPKKTVEIPPRIPGAVSPAALTAIVSQRIISLAKPAQRPPGRETDLREDAFTVSPTALKARCSKRIKRLAKPKIRPKIETAKKPKKSKPRAARKR